MHAGRLALVGTTSEVKRVFANRPIVEVRTDRPVDLLRVLDGMPEVEKTSLFGTAVHAVLRDPSTRPAAIADRLRANGLAVLSIDQVPPSLEDVFLDVVEKAAAGEESAA
jgi:ABC-2 type transport system ATP-binding protein